MKDGGLENKKELENSKKQSKSSKFRSKSDDFALAIAKVAVAQVCESVGFQSFQHSALETLSDVTARYIYTLGKTTNFNANLAGRLESNVFDVIQGLEELESGLGFAGASDINRCLAKSGFVRDIVHFVGDAADVRFAYDVPRFPVVKERKGMGSFQEKGEEPHGEHIPSWLPAFPDPEAYATESTVGNGTTSGSDGVKTGLVRIERKIEWPLLNFQQQFARNGNVGDSSCVGGDSGKAWEVSNSNPYLAAPLHFGEKEVDVSPVVLPTKLSNEVASRDPVSENRFVGNHVSVLETFAPAIEGIKSGMCEYSSKQKNVLYNQRPTVHFKIGIGKKSLNTAPDFISKNKDLQKIAYWFENDNEKDDRKRRAENFMKESMECSQEPGQL
ncbi:LRR receptor-like serine/threonine-protein kinase RPK2 [Hibiscus syriacus]|uniref:Transcription initiation factor TFIID subunit 8 n=1 Tax=Hibiscus syriacus TaxID=106335 RepID=A0A6A2ZXZ7_HIBSY|nr:transcription initiation factor TFIID subunit 8-like [Hibiscus syriacus]KAE8695745.1 LRR receptor-like serine/threonine-protein kinase RPK2 [Hibiscus syriacus]